LEEEEGAIARLSVSFWWEPGNKEVLRTKKPGMRGRTTKTEVTTTRLWMLHVLALLFVWNFLAVARDVSGSCGTGAIMVTDSVMPQHSGLGDLACSPATTAISRARPSSWINAYLPAIVAVCGDSLPLLPQVSVTARAQRWRVQLASSSALRVIFDSTKQRAGWMNSSVVPLRCASSSRCFVPLRMFQQMLCHSTRASPAPQTKRSCWIRQCWSRALKQRAGWGSVLLLLQ
jgi:hypothetical protein